MALKEVNGEFNGLTGDLYHQIHNVTGMELGKNPHAHIRKRVFSSEEFRTEHPDKPIVIDMENFPISREAADQIKEILYVEMKKKEVIKETINHPAEKDEGGDIIKEAWTEEVIEKPYENMIDLI